MRRNKLSFKQIAALQKSQASHAASSAAAAAAEQRNRGPATTGITDPKPVAPRPSPAPTPVVVGPRPTPADTTPLEDYPTSYDLQQATDNDDVARLVGVWGVDTIVAAYFRDNFRPKAITTILTRNEVDYSQVDFQSAQAVGRILAGSTLASQSDYVLEMVAKGNRGVISLIDQYGSDVVREALIANGYSAQQASELITAALATDVSGTNVEDLVPLKGEGDKWKRKGGDSTPRGRAHYVSSTRGMADRLFKRIIVMSLMSLATIVIAKKY